MSSSGIPKWVSWSLTSADQGTGRYDGNFITDTSLPAGMKRVTHSDYTNSGYDRGHMCPNADRNVTLNDASRLSSSPTSSPRRRTTTRASGPTSRPTAAASPTAPAAKF